MDSWAEIILATVTAFVATNVDDLFVLMIFFSQRSPSFRTSHIVLGQYLGFCALVGISALGMVAGIFIPAAWIGLLGFLPVFLAVKKFLQRGTREAPAPAVAAADSGGLGNLIAAPTLSVAGVTLANGGDNIGVYVAFFANFSAAPLAAVVGMFLVLVAVWCVIAGWLGRHPLTAAVVDRCGHYLVPLVLAGMGFYILYKSGAWALLLGSVTRA
jgi:cadmium resistance transport/sequestration family protein